MSSLFTHQIKRFLHPFAQNILATILITVVPTANTLIWAITLWALTESRALNHAESGQGQRFLLICADESGFQHWCSLVRWTSASYKNLTDSRFLLCKWGTRAVPILRKLKAKVAQSCPTLCDPMDCTVHGILQARIAEWVAFPSPGDLPNPGVPHCRQILHLWATRGSPALQRSQNNSVEQCMCHCIAPDIRLWKFGPLQAFSEESHYFYYARPLHVSPSVLWKKNLRIRKYCPSFTDDEFDVAKAKEITV